MKTTIRLSLSLALALLSGSLLGQAHDGRAPLPKPKSYGTDQISYYRMPASDFTLLDTASGMVYSDTAYPAPTITSGTLPGAPAGSWHLLICPRAPC